jgi:hypothetical protein
LSGYAAEAAVAIKSDASAKPARRRRLNIVESLEERF